MSALEVKRLVHSGRSKYNEAFSVGGVSGLLLQVTANGGKTWLLRTVIGAKRREIGLGGYPDVSLAVARDKARDFKDKIRNGIDPIEERKVLKADLVAAQRRGLLFKDAVERYLDAKLDQYKNAKHRQQWRNTLTTYALPELGDMLVQEIQVQDVLRVLEPIWQSKTETATRVRGRIEAVLSWATVAGHRSGDNPARWASNLKELLPAPNKVSKVRHHPAVQVEDIPNWFTQVRNRSGIGSRALEFVAMTAIRSQEVRRAKWEDVDLERGIWVTPADHIKMEREHRIPLPRDAVLLLTSLPRFEGNPLIFPAPRGGELSDATLSGTMKRIHAKNIADGGEGFVDRETKRPAVPHGLRSTFRDWVSERTHFPGDMAEIALAHKVSNAVEAAYRRGDMMEKRRKMMEAWTDFLNGRQQDGHIIQFAGAN
jgi:integrase